MQTESPSVPLSTIPVGQCFMFPGGSTPADVHERCERDADNTAGQEITYPSGKTLMKKMVNGTLRTVEPEAMVIPVAYRAVRD